MHRFVILFKGSPVGYSDLEAGDPPMGVAFGRFYPGPNFESSMVSPEVRKHLSVKSVFGDEPLICEGVGIMTSAAVGLEESEVEVLGIQGEQYTRVFPEHVAAYEKSCAGG